MKTRVDTAVARFRGGFSIFANKNGYTIVEVMIFLAVTGLMFAMMMLAFSGRQGRAQFQTAARDMEAIVRDVINDVSTGYYPRIANFSCTPSLTGPVISTVTNTAQGANSGCIYVGRVLHFDVDGVPADQYHVYSLTGLRRDPVTGRETTTYTEARPKVIRPITERMRTPSGMVIRRMYYDPPNATDPNLDLDGLAMTSSLGAYDADGNLESAALDVTAVPIFSSVIGGAAGSTEGDMIGMLDSLNQGYVSWFGNVPGKIVICMDSQSSRQYAELAIGGSQNSQLATDLIIKEGFCP